MRFSKTTRLAISRNLLVSIVVIIIVIAAVGSYAAISLTSGSSSSSTTATSTTPESWIIDFTPSGLQLPVYVAVAKGYFAQNGIQMSVISNPQGSVGSTNAVAKGTATFGDADFGTFVHTSYTGNITNVKVVGGWVGDGGGSGVIYLSGSGIHTPKDLEGKTIGSFTGDSDENLFTVFAKANGLNISSITIDHVSVSALEPGLLSGQFAAILLYQQHLVELTPLAAQKGQTVGFFNFGDYGLSGLLAQSVITTTGMIQNNPQIVSGVLKAFYEGVQYSWQNPQDAVNAMASIVSGLNTTLTLAQFETFSPYYNANITTVKSYSNPLYAGWIDPNAVSSSLTTIGSAYNFSPPSASTLYTNQFVVQPGH